MPRTPTFIMPFPSKKAETETTLESKCKSLQPCICQVKGCGKRFSKKSNLKAHMRVHNGIFPYGCVFPGCSKRFRWKSSIKPHVRVHLTKGDALDAGNAPPWAGRIVREEAEVLKSKKERLMLKNCHAISPAHDDTNGIVATFDGSYLHDCSRNNNESASRQVIDLSTPECAFNNVFAGVATEDQREGSETDDHNTTDLWQENTLSHVHVTQASSSVLDNTLDPIVDRLLERDVPIQDPFNDSADRPASNAGGHCSNVSTPSISLLWNQSDVDDTWVLPDIH